MQRAAAKRRVNGRRRLAALALGSLVVGASGCSGCFDFDLGLDHLFDCDPGCKGAVPGGNKTCGLLGGCTVACSPGYDNCNGSAADGCETHVNDTANCGACGVTCGLAQSCRDGACVDDTVTSTDGSMKLAENLASPAGLAADGQYVVYIDRGSLYRVVRDGGDTTRLASGLRPAGGVAMDGTYVYFAQVAPSDAGAGGGDSGAAGGDGGADAGTEGGAATAGLFRVRITGGPLEAVAPADPLPGIEASPGTVYFRDRRDGGGALLAYRGDAGMVALADLGGTALRVRPFSVGGSSIAAIDDDAIVAVPLDGGAKQTLVPQTGGALAVASSKTDVVYYAAAHDGGGFDLLRAGSDVARHEIGAVAGLVFDPPYLFVADDAAGSIVRIDTGIPTLLDVAIVTGQHGITALAIDDTYVYWITRTAPQELWRAPREP